MRLLDFFNKSLYFSLWKKIKGECEQLEKKPIYYFYKNVD